MHSGPMQSDDDEEIRRNSTPRRVRFILLTQGDWEKGIVDRSV